MFRPTTRLCTSCSCQLLTLFTNGFALSSKVSRLGSKPILRNGTAGGYQSLSRSFMTRSALRASVEHDEWQNDESTRNLAHMETIVRQARQTFGETLPENFLSEEEYRIYERLYGPPSATTLPEDVALLQGLGEEDADVDEVSANVLMREDKDGNLEEIVYEDEADEDLGELSEDTAAEILEELKGRTTTEGTEVSMRSESELPFQDRLNDLQDKYATLKGTRQSEAEEKVLVEEEEEVDGAKDSLIVEEQEVDDELEESEDAIAEYERSDAVRSHPLTSAGHSGTAPSTLQLPQETLVDPVSALLADASNRQLAEVTQKTFGGPGLPNSTATIKRPHLVQQTMPLEASQGRMGEMDANAYLAAIYPGAYASVMSTLVEVRKRLGSTWLRNLMQRRDGPRILDAGSAGAAVLAWREVIQAEYDAMHPDLAPKTTRPPFGKSTVVTGSPSLRLRASALLDDTTFIPRLPDYDPSRDHPSLEISNPQPRKQYDIIIAPYTLWSLSEDHMRKSQIQNFWSLLDPRGGVLILVEKGVPRGFELIAGARETLLKHHISSLGAEVVENTIESANENRFGPKEQGMIIAPCTNHGKCPMYIHAGKSQGRKDFCHFNQRFIRPPHLQRILGDKDRNHEDIQFSYVALQRGRDLRKEQDFSQGEAAAVAAFAGFENADTAHGGVAPNTLSLPRAILPPIKRKGHIILDLCTPGAKIERWTVPKSFSKQAYRDARKSKWGDLWALGAKTRVGRNIRVGVKKEKAKGRKVQMVEEEEREERGNKVEVEGKGMSGIKGKADPRERKGRSGRAKYPRKEAVEDEAIGF